MREREREMQWRIEWYLEDLSNRATHTTTTNLLDRADISMHDLIDMAQNTLTLLRSKVVIRLRRHDQQRRGLVRSPR